MDGDLKGRSAVRWPLRGKYGATELGASARDKVREGGKSEEV